MAGNPPPDGANLAAQLQVFQELLNLNPQLAAGMFQDNVIQNLFAQLRPGMPQPEAPEEVNNAPVVVEQPRPVEVPVPRPVQFFQREEHKTLTKEESANLLDAFKKQQEKEKKP